MADNFDEDDLLNSSLTNLQWLQHINMNLSEGLAVPRKTVASSSSSASSSPQSKVSFSVLLCLFVKFQSIGQSVDQFF